MPRPNLDNMEPWDISNINRALKSNLSRDKYDLRKWQAQREYAFKKGDRKKRKSPTLLVNYNEQS